MILQGQWILPIGGVASVSVYLRLQPAQQAQLLDDIISSKLSKIKCTANYAGQLFAPAEGVWPLLKGYFFPLAKNGLPMQFWYF